MSVMLKMTKRIDANEAGVASILITIIMVVVISLIVLGFAQIARREQRASIDRLLSTQAYYAAETGVNDALDAINNKAYLTLFPNGKASCSPNVGDNILTKPPYNSGSIGNSSSGIGYTCLRIEPSPSTLQYDHVDQNNVAIFTLETTNASHAQAPANYITVAWQQSGVGSPLYSTCNSLAGQNYNFPTTSAWSGCNAGVLRMDIIADADIQSRLAVQASTETVFLRPQKSGVVGSPYTFNGTSYPSNSFVFNGCATASTPGLHSCDTAGTLNGTIVAANCTNGGSCTATLYGVSDGVNIFHVRLTSIYTQSLVTFSASPSTIGFSGAETAIDSTGKANDVLRRILVYVQSKNGLTNNVPNFAVQSTNTVCKRLEFDQNQKLVLPVDTNGVGAGTDTTSCHDPSGNNAY